MHACELIIAGDPRIGKVPGRGELRDRGRRRRLNLFPMTLWLSSGQARVYKPAPKGPAPSSFVQPDDHSSTRLHTQSPSSCRDMRGRMIKIFQIVGNAGFMMKSLDER